MAAVRDLSTSDAVFKSMTNNTLEHVEDFPYEECLREEQKDCMKNMVNGKDVFAILPTGFGKSLIFQLFPTSNVFDDCDRPCLLHNHGDSVVYTSRGHNERPS